MPKKIVIDACVAIDLYIPKVNFLEEFLRCSKEDQILISSVNYEEIIKVAQKKPYCFNSYKIQQLFKSSDNVKITENDKTGFDNFYSELISLKIGMGINDAHVLFLANESKADFVVSSDFNVFDKANQFKNKKKLRYMVAFTTVDLLAYLYEQGKIEYGVFLEKTLHLYKYKEIDNMLEHLKEKDFRVSKPDQDKIIDDFKHSMKIRFNDYENPLLKEFEYLLALLAKGRLPT